MNFEEKYNPIEGFDFNALNDPEFKEDSVREEILSPIIKALGYSASGKNKIVRSRKLIHPYVNIGSQTKNIYLIPDYVMEIDNKPSWILEAKSPTEKILNTKHTEQAYSYAIHPEIRAKYYALSNGREFLLYSINEYKPILYFNMLDLPFYWESLKKFLLPELIEKNFYVNPKFVKDLGLHLKRLGFKESVVYYFYNIAIDEIVKIDNNLYTICSTTTIDNTDYCASFDFEHNVMLQLKDKIPLQAFNKLIIPTNFIQRAQFSNLTFKFRIKCTLADKLQETETEIFLPLKVLEFL